MKTHFYDKTSKCNHNKAGYIKIFSILLSLTFFIVFCLSGCFLKDLFSPNKDGVIADVKGNMSFHFLDVGNGHSGDSIYVKAGEVDILIDAGSLRSSAPTLKKYIDSYCTDNALEYVIVTHAHEDHIAGFSANDGIFDSYVCETIIDFPKTNSSSKVYGDYITKRDAEIESGATHYTALQCYEQTGGAKRTYQFTESMSMTILYNYYYENKTSDENDYSVCVLFSHGDRNFLFTGDLEEKGEEYLVQYNDLPEVEVYKAGHHGSKTSSNNVLLQEIKPQIVCVTCCAGSVEYLTTTPQNLSNSFPTQDFIDRVAGFTEKVYVTAMIETIFDEKKGKHVDYGDYKLLNGNIVVLSKEGALEVQCSNNNTLLKDTQWFKNNRTAPDEWDS